jgi:hypothetical protein
VFWRFVTAEEMLDKTKVQARFSWLSFCNLDLAIME